MRFQSDLNSFITRLFLLALLGVTVTAQAQQTCTLWLLGNSNWAGFGADHIVVQGANKQALCEELAEKDIVRQNNRYPNYVFRVQAGSVDGAYYSSGLYRCHFEAESRALSGGSWSFSGAYTSEYVNLGECSLPSNNTVNRQKNVGAQCLTTGNPINTATGNKYQEEIDYVSSGALPLRFARYYNSHLWSQSSAPPVTGEFTSHIGYNWRSSFDAFIRYTNSGSAPTAYVYRPDGRLLTFVLSGGVFSPEADVADRLVKLTNGSGVVIGWAYTVAARDEVETFDAAGNLVSITARTGQTQTLVYDTGGRLTTVTDSFGRVLTFTYDSNNRLAILTDPSGNDFTYAYNAVGNVSSVTHPDGTVRTYVYGETGTPYSLTGIVDENSARYSTYEYDVSSPELATSTELAGGVNHYSLAYGSGGSSTTATDPLGVVRTYTFSTMHRMAKNTSIDQPCSSGCGGGAAAATTYDSNGNISQRTDFNGNITTYSYDLVRNLETSRTEAWGTARARTINTTWHSTFRLPTQITEANRTTSFTYDSNGNQLTRTITDTSATPNTARTWTYTYNSFGQVLTEDGPRTVVTDTTTYSYHSTSATCTATVTGATTTGCRGQLNTVTNALSHVTTINEYNAHGQPLKITDPNGLVTTLVYDLRQRITSRTTGSETTAFTYWPTGLLRKVTSPDGSYLEYSYDNAHRLIRMDDSEGNYVVYTLDVMGNRTKEETFDPTNYLVRKHHRVFNSLNRLWKEIGSANTSNVTTLFGYDNNGNQTTIEAALNRDTTNAYDELNRLTQITDPASGNTQFAYDANDNLTSVTDPRSLVTSYEYNGYGEVTEQTSPDTGVTTNTYNPAGDLSSRTDARNKTGTYSYDAINRLTSIVYSDQTITYTYDTGTNNKGRLMQVSDNSGSTSWTYTTLGRVASRTQVMGSTSKTVGYGYNSAGQMTSITTPSGQTLTYSYADGRISGITVNSTTLLSNALYSPFGPISQWDWGNSTLAVRTFDLDGNITQIDSAGLNTYALDDAFRVTDNTDVDVTGADWNYEYDALDRVMTSEAFATTLESFTYSANGNRLTDSGFLPKTYTYSSSSNRLLSMTGGPWSSYVYDAAGNVSQINGSGFTGDVAYNDAGRMTGLGAGGTPFFQYAYNAMAQRVYKSAPTWPSGMAIFIYFVYDEAGHLLGEYDASGNLIQETVWLEDIPVATLKPNGSGGVDIFYIHADHLNTPRKITRPSDNAVLWVLTGNTFGSGADQDFDGDSNVFDYNLRLPGQYRDPEFPWHYNHHRYYDFINGIYLQSDPIGLSGGVNSYAYVANNPVMMVDELGLLPTCTSYEIGSLIKMWQEHVFKTTWESKRIPVPVPTGFSDSPGLDIDPRRMRRLPVPKPEIRVEWYSVMYQLGWDELWEITQRSTQFQTFCEETSSDNCGRTKIDRYNYKWQKEWPQIRKFIERNLVWKYEVGRKLGESNF